MIFQNILTSLDSESIDLIGVALYKSLCFQDVHQIGPVLYNSPPNRIFQHELDPRLSITVPYTSHNGAGYLTQI